MAIDRDDAELRHVLAEAVEAARLDLGVSIAEAVRRSEADPATKVSRTKWTQVEEGHAPLPGKTTIVKIARVLGVEPNELLSAAGYSPRNVFVSHSAEDEPTVRELLAGIGDEMHEMRIALQRLSTVYEQLAPPARPDPPAPGEFAGTSAGSVADEGRAPRRRGAQGTRS